MVLRDVREYFSVKSDVRSLEQSYEFVVSEIACARSRIDFDIP